MGEHMSPTGDAPESFTVHKRLLEGAVEDLTGNFAEYIQRTVGGQLAGAVEEVAVQAYTRGVRDGYVQAVAEAGDG